MTDLTQGALAPVTAPAVYIFQNGKPHAVRIMADDQGEPLFHVGDLCDLLEHTNPSRAISQHVEKDDLTKRYVIDRMGRQQFVNFVSEPGMWSLLIGSHAPNAKKVKRWLTSEVLPAIRKTGRYVVQQAEPEPVREPEYITNSDHTNLARLVWQCTNDRRYGRAWNFSIWKDLRRVTRTQSPTRFEVDHLPVLAAELERIYAATSLLEDAVRRCEVEFLRRVFRQGEDGAAVVAELEAQILKTAASKAESFRTLLHAWQQRDVQRLRNREPAGLGLEQYPGGLEAGA